MVLMLPSLFQLFAGFEFLCTHMHVHAVCHLCLVETEARLSSERSLDPKRKHTCALWSPRHTSSDASGASSAISGNRTQYGTVAACRTCAWLQSPSMPVHWMCQWTIVRAYHAGVLALPGGVTCERAVLTRRRAREAASLATIVAPLVQNARLSRSVPAALVDHLGLVREATSCDGAGRRARDWWISTRNLGPTVP